MFVVMGVGLLTGLPDGWRFFDVAFVVVLVKGRPPARPLGHDASAAAE